MANSLLLLKAILNIFFSSPSSSNNTLFLSTSIKTTLCFSSKQQHIKYLLSKLKLKDLTPKYGIVISHFSAKLLLSQILTEVSPLSYIS